MRAPPHRRRPAAGLPPPVQRGAGAPPHPWRFPIPYPLQSPPNLGRPSLLQLPALLVAGTQSTRSVKLAAGSKPESPFLLALFTTPASFLTILSLYNVWSNSLLPNESLLPLEAGYGWIREKLEITEGGGEGRFLQSLLSSPFPSVNLSLRVDLAAAMEPDLDMAAMRKKLEDAVLGTWLWDKELDSIVQEQKERNDEGDYEYYEPDEPHESDQEEEELHYGGSWGYGYTFYYEDGNPYYVADMEERWEKMIRC
ncbi:uncharacterized protein LOC119284108 [Triticum dicoccoides]|uniref:uncharacterized protein LOC119284108 n=1 Tax=Triticum dicoccoides TaxID=85692 RepID=UPI00188DE307|nr:uncharacterized protein LOC119284108 [Triticum dicoccoides]